MPRVRLLEERRRRSLPPNCACRKVCPAAIAVHAQRRPGTLRSMLADMVRAEYRSLRALSGFDDEDRVSRSERHPQLRPDD